MKKIFSLCLLLILSFSLFAQVSNDSLDVSINGKSVKIKLPNHFLEVKFSKKSVKIIEFSTKENQLKKNINLKSQIETSLVLHNVIYNFYSSKIGNVRFLIFIPHDKNQSILNLKMIAYNYRSKVMLFEAEKDNKTIRYSSKKK